MAIRLEGKPVTDALRARQAAAVQALAAKEITPTLAILRLGERGDDLAYERGACKRCEGAGIATRIMPLPEDATQAQLLSLIEGVNNDSSIHGVLLLRPLPRHMDDETVRNALAPQKDIDGIGDASLAGIFAGTGTGFAPCTAQACLEMLEYYGYALEGKRVVVVGRSLVVGKPVAMMLLQRNATVTMCHTRTAELAKTCREAEILIVAAGRAGVLGKEAVSPGQVVIDVGINYTPDGRLCGDVAFEEVEPIVAAISPVPGGVGAITTSVLAGNVIRAAELAMR